MEKEKRKIKQSLTQLVITKDRSIMIYRSKDATQDRINSGMQRMLNGSLKATKVIVYKISENNGVSLEWQAIWEHDSTKVRPSLPDSLETEVLDRIWRD